MLADRIRMANYKKPIEPNRFILATGKSTVIWQYSLNNLSQRKIADFRMSMKTVCDEKYGYGAYGSTLSKFDKDTLITIKSITLPGSFAHGIALDDNYIYVQSSTDVIKYSKLDLTEVARYSSAVSASVLLVDNQYLYILEYDWTKPVRLYKINKVTMKYDSYITSNSYANWDFAQDGEFLYVVGNIDSLSNPSLKKFRKSNLSLVTTATGGTGGRRHDRHSSIAIDSNYVYVGGGDSNGSNAFSIWKFNKSDLSFVLASPQEYASYASLAVDGEFLYIGGYSRVVVRLSKSNLSYSGQTPAYPASISNITIC